MPSFVLNAKHHVLWSHNFATLAVKSFGLIFALACTLRTVIKTNNSNRDKVKWHNSRKLV